MSSSNEDITIQKKKKENFTMIEPIFLKNVDGLF